MTIQQQFKNLNGSTVSRSQLEVIIANAKKANDTEIIYRLSGILLANKGVNRFYVSLRQYPTALAGSMHKGAYKEALTECGRLRKGWRFHKGGVLKIASVDKKTKQIKMALNGKKPCGCGGTKKTCGCKKKKLNANNLSFDELEGLGLPFVPNPESVEDPTALGKPFTNDDIYQMITDKMISLVEKASGKGVQKKWGQKEFYEKDGFLIPINFVSKNAYRGVNPWLLKDDFFSVMDNPYFMTFKQIKEKKGTLKKGSKGTPIVYFTLLYKFDNPKTKKEFGTYDKEYMIKYIKNFGYSKSDFDDVVNSIAILKYYNVFNGSDIEDIDFKLDELQLGRVLKSDESLANEKNEIAELIVKNYPKPAPTIKHGGNDAYHQESADLVQMPRLQSFDTPNDYYAVLFHELIHSTGNKKRLTRKLGNKFGSKEYAKEELIAEFGAVFLSAQSGIIWHSNKNHAEYLKNWQSVLKIAKDDNKFLMRGASAAQKASDFVLNLDANNVPAFYKELSKITVPKKTVKEKATKKTKKNVSIPDSSAYPVAVPETKITIKANAPFDSCGRLRKGWKFQNGKPVQVIPKKKATKKAEIKKVVKAVIKKIEKPTKSIKLPSKEIDLKSEIELEDRYIKEVTALLQETRAKSKKTQKDKKNINYWVIAIKEAKKRKSINNKLLKELLQKPTKKTTETFVKPAVKVVKTDTSFKRPGSLPVQLEQVETGMLSARSSLYSWERYLKGVYPSWVEDRYTDDFCLKNIDYFKRLVEAFENQKKMIIKRDRKTTRTVVKPTPIKLGNPKNPKNPENPKKTNSLAYKMANRQNKVSEIYKIRDKNISEFLGEIEVKQKESVVITLTGGQGSMKTRCAFRFMNAFAQKYKVGHASIEEHPESTLYYNKVDEYINDNALNNIHNPEINSISDLDKLVKENDIIVIDSFAKMQEIQKGFEVDKDLRKKYDGKLFIVIFQQTTDGKMRGGSKSQFDADIILFTEKFDNYQDNYIYADKNRYQNKNLTDLKYNIFEGKLNTLEISEV
ncbi:ssDNA-binding domain-containing protein [Tenacibaculum dicentrarchi]|nr:ssDNA-binding domain-containing protein [Tenacibaculum dicentrarchi]